jgi:hypothetical protein
MAWQRIALGVLAALAVAPPAAPAHELSAPRAPLASLPSLPAPSQSSDAPDLRIALPTVPYSGQVAPVYVDAYEQPGRLLYRFDAVIQNTGGALDLFGGASEVRQKIWPGGEPSAAPVPDAPPPGPSEDRTPTGARFAYVTEPTHEHWHFFSAARYSLLVPGGEPRVSDKVGFCMFDSFDIDGGATKWFPEDAAPPSWCRETEPGSTFVRMGLSRGSGDRYSAQREFQYVDVTGLTPGTYTLRAQANPDGHLIEADPSDDVHEEQRIVPGVVASPGSLTVAAGGVGAVELSAQPVAPEIPARRAASCTPRATVEACYSRITASSPLVYSVASGPGHGAASFDGARVTYVSAAGFSGRDSLTYVATDGRGLRSAPATVEIEVTPPAQPPIVEPPVPRRLLLIGATRWLAPKRLAVRLHCRPAATGTCAGTLEARIHGRRAGRSGFSALPAGRRRTVTVRLRRPATGRRVVLRATVSDAAGPGVPAQRVLRARGGRPRPLSGT